MKLLFQKCVFMGLRDQGSWSKSLKPRIHYCFAGIFLCCTDCFLHCQMSVAPPFIVTKETSLPRHFQTPPRGVTDQTLEPIRLWKAEAATYCWSKTIPAALQSSPEDLGLATLKSKVWPPIWAPQFLISDKAPVTSDRCQSCPFWLITRTCLLILLLLETK